MPLLAILAASAALTLAAHRADSRRLWADALAAVAALDWKVIA